MVANLRCIWDFKKLSCIITITFYILFCGRIFIRGRFIGGTMPATIISIPFKIFSCITFFTFTIVFSSVIDSKFLRLATYFSTVRQLSSVFTNKYFYLTKNIWHFEEMQMKTWLYFIASFTINLKCSIFKAFEMIGGHFVFPANNPSIWKWRFVQ